MQTSLDFVECWIRYKSQTFDLVIEQPAIENSQTHHGADKIVETRVCFVQACKSNVDLID